MIDIENYVFTKVKQALIAEFPNIEVSSTFIRTPSKFPAVSIIEGDNSTYIRGVDSSGVENFANLMFQVDVWSNKASEKKGEAKKIFEIVSDTLTSMGFYRSLKRSVSNQENEKIYRIIGRFTCVASKAGDIYGR